MYQTIPGRYRANRWHITGARLQHFETAVFLLRKFPPYYLHPYIPPYILTLFKCLPFIHLRRNILKWDMM